MKTIEGWVDRLALLDAKLRAALRDCEADCGRGPAAGSARGIALTLLEAYPLEDPQEHERAGTLIGCLATGFMESDQPVADAGAFNLARRTWRALDLVALDHQALALSTRLCPVDRLRVALAFYQRAELGRSLLGLRDAGDSLVVFAELLASLAGEATWPDAARARALELVPKAMISTARYREVRRSISPPADPPAKGAS